MKLKLLIKSTPAIIRLLSNVKVQITVIILNVSLVLPHLFSMLKPKNVITVMELSIQAQIYALLNLL